MSLSSTCDRTMGAITMSKRGKQGKSGKSESETSSSKSQAPPDNPLSPPASPDPSLAGRALEDPAAAPSEISYPPMDDWEAMSHEDKCKAAGVLDSGPTPLAPWEPGYEHGLKNIERRTPEPVPFDGAQELGAAPPPPPPAAPPAPAPPAAKEEPEFKPFIQKADAVPATPPEPVYSQRRQGFPWIPLPDKDRMKSAIKVKFWLDRMCLPEEHVVIWCHSATVTAAGVTVCVNKMNKDPYLISESAFDGAFIPERRL